MITLTSIVRPDEEMYVAFCPELDVASQGDTFISAWANLGEAIALLLECASKTEMERRLANGPYTFPSED